MVPPIDSALLQSINSFDGLKHLSQKFDPYNYFNNNESNELDLDLGMNYNPDLSLLKPPKKVVNVGKIPPMTLPQNSTNMVLASTKQIPPITLPPQNSTIMVLASTKQDSNVKYHLNPYLDSDALLAARQASRNIEASNSIGYAKRGGFNYPPVRHFSPY